MIYIGNKYKAKYFDYTEEGVYFSLYDKHSKMWVRFFTKSSFIEYNYILLDSVVGFRNYKYKGINQMLPELVVYNSYD